MNAERDTYSTDMGFGEAQAIVSGSGVSFQVQSRRTKCKSFS